MKFTLEDLEAEAKRRSLEAIPDDDFAERLNRARRLKRLRGRYEELAASIALTVLPLPEGYPHTPEADERHKDERAEYCAVHAEIRKLSDIERQLAEKEKVR